MDTRPSLNRSVEIQGMDTRLPIVLLLLASCGCATFQDHEYAKANRGRADRAWKTREASGDARCESKDYMLGWKAGYLDVCRGGCGNPPPVAPKRYWAAKYQSPDGQGAIQDWFLGFETGAAAAKSCGEGSFHLIPTSNTASPPLGPYRIHRFPPLDCGLEGLCEEDHEPDGEELGEPAMPASDKPAPATSSEPAPLPTAESPQQQAAATRSIWDEAEIDWPVAPIFRREAVALQPKQDVALQPKRDVESDLEARDALAAMPLELASSPSATAPLPTRRPVPGPVIVEKRLRAEEIAVPSLPIGHPEPATEVESEPVPTRSRATVAGRAVKFPKKAN